MLTFISSRERINGSFFFFCGRVWKSKSSFLHTTIYHLILSTYSADICRVVVSSEIHARVLSVMMKQGYYYCPRGDPIGSASRKEMGCFSSVSSSTLLGWLAGWLWCQQHSPPFFCSCVWEKGSPRKNNCCGGHEYLLSMSVAKFLLKPKHLCVCAVIITLS